MANLEAEKEQSQSADEPDKPVWLDQLMRFRNLKLTEQILIVVGVCYGSGFLITNLHLIVYGIVSGELLRTRYIATGILFLGFLSIVSIALYGFFSLLSDYRAQRRNAKKSDLFFYSFGITFGGLFLAGALELLTGTTLRPPVSVPYLLQPSYWWLGLASTMLLLLILMGGGFLISSLWQLLRRSAPQLSWQTRLRNTFTPFASSTFISLLAGIIALPYLLDSWLRYFATAIAIYLVVVLWNTRSYFLFPLVNLEKLNTTFPPPDPTQEHWLSILTMRLITPVVLPILLLLVYIRFVFPDLPQELGGGGMEQVIRCTPCQDH
jgi:hypothetical protein